MRTFALILATTLGLLGLLGAVGCGNRTQNILLSEAPRVGASFILEIDSAPATDNTNRLAELKEAMIRRFSKFGSQFFWEPLSETRVRVVVPAAGRDSFEAVKGFIARAGKMEFRLVHPHSDQLIRDGVNAHDYDVVERVLEPSGTPVPIPGNLIYQKIEPSPPHVERILVKKPEPDLAGDLIEKVTIASGELGIQKINIRLKPTAAAAMAKLTGENVGGDLAMVLDGQLYIATKIFAPINSGNFSLSGGPTINGLFLILTCPYPVPVKLLEVKIL